MLIAFAYVVLWPCEPQRPPLFANLGPEFEKLTDSDADDPPLRKLRKARCRERGTAILQYRFLLRDQLQHGGLIADTLSNYTTLLGTFTENVAELVEKPADRVIWYERRVAHLKGLEVLGRILARGGRGDHEFNFIAAARLEAELALNALRESLTGNAAQTAPFVEPVPCAPVVVIPCVCPSYPSPTWSHPRCLGFRRWR